jgi:cytosolic carboxypeptidase protein 2/3
LNHALKAAILDKSKECMIKLLFSLSNKLIFIKRGQFEYELVLRTDLFTERHTQWFFFKVSNMLPKTTYRFRIINLRKNDSLYNHG